MSDPVTYTAVLPVAEETVLLVFGLLGAEQRRQGIRRAAQSVWLLPPGAGAARVHRGFEHLQPVCVELICVRSRLLLSGYGGEQAVEQ